MLTAFGNGLGQMLGISFGILIIYIVLRLIAPVFLSDSIKKIKNAINCLR